MKIPKDGHSQIMSPPSRFAANTPGPRQARPNPIVNCHLFFIMDPGISNLGQSAVVLHLVQDHIHGLVQLESILSNRNTPLFIRKSPREQSKMFVRPHQCSKMGSINNVRVSSTIYVTFPR